MRGVRVIKPEDRRTRKMVDNFVKKHGEAEFTAFIEGLVNDESGGAWARRLSVSRERVRQWRDSFVKRIVYVYPSEVVQDKLKALD